MLLYPVHKRQLILVDDVNSDNSSTVPQVNPNHHPIIMLKKAHVDSTNILKEVACHDGTVIKNNLFRTSNSKWTVESEMVASYPTER